MKKGFVIFIMATIVAACASAQTAVKSLNDGWAFSEDNRQWEQVSIPHTWNTDAYSTKTYKQKKCYYKRNLYITPNLKEKQYLLKFEAASKEATVYLNGKQIGHHAGAYTAFVVDLTPYLKADAKNELLVEVDNATPHVAPISADFTFMGGIYRNVKLIISNKQHISNIEDGADGVFVSQTKVTDQTATLSIKSRLRNDASDQSACVLRHQVYSPEGKLLSTSEKKIKLAAGKTVSLQMGLPAIQRPALWTPEKPILYKVKTTLLSAKGNKTLDSQEHEVGLRYWSIDPEKGFFLNGKPYKLNGMCRHQDMKPYGVALDDDMQRRDFRLMKEMGCNFVRLAHYPQAESVLEMCDKLGMLVWEEIPVVNFVPDDQAFMDNAAQQLKEMIRQHYNHSSVVFWGYMNEILLRARGAFPKQEDFDACVTRTQDLAKRLEAVLHEEDPWRLSAMAFHGSNDYNKLLLSDVPQTIGWNLYQGWYGGDLTGFERYLADQHQHHPDHPVIVSEWGAGSDFRLHSDKGEAFDFCMEYQQKYIEHYLPVISNTPYILGGSYWNFVDFSSADRGESMPYINNKGVVTAERQKKDVFYYFKAVWRKDVPVLHIAARDWQVRETVSPGHAVKVYTNAANVSLQLNGKPLGTKQVDNCLALFPATLQEGVNWLKATASVNGEQVEDYMSICYKPVAGKASELTELAVNVGSHCWFQSGKTGVTWQPDQPYREGSWGYVGGKTQTTQSIIACTEDGPLYQTMREGIEAYCFDVPAGKYELELLFTDIHQKQAQSAYLLGKDAQQADLEGIAKFSIDVNGEVLEQDFMPAVEDGFFRAVRRSYIVETKTPQLKVNFMSEGKDAFLSGIKLRAM